MSTTVKKRRDDAVNEAKRQLLRVDKASGQVVALNILQRCLDEEQAEFQKHYNEYLEELERACEDG